MLIARVLHILAQRGVTARIDVDFALREDGDGPYIALWNNDLLGARPTAEELAAVTEEESQQALPRQMLTREILRRMTAAEHRALERFGLLSEDERAADVLKLINLLKADRETNVHSAEAVEGWTLIKAVGVAIGLWADAAAADARVVEILA